MLRQVATNELLRDYFPKGTDLSTHSTQHLLAVENELNNRPRLVLNDRALAEPFGALLASGPALKILLRLIFVSISSGVLVQMKGCLRSFQAAMNWRILPVSSRTERKVPRRMAWRSMMPNQTSRFSHDPEVGVKCRWMRGFAASQALTSGRLWVP
jgi:hypothetical protein